MWTMSHTTLHNLSIFGGFCKFLLLFVFMWLEHVAGLTWTCISCIKAQWPLSLHTLFVEKYSKKVTRIVFFFLFFYMFLAKLELAALSFFRHKFLDRYSVHYSEWKIIKKKKWARLGLEHVADLTQTLLSCMCTKAQSLSPPTFFIFLAFAWLCRQL